MENEKLVRLSDVFGKCILVPHLNGAEAVMESDLYDIPAVDAVEVVRCNMCLFRPKGSTYCYELERHTVDGYYCAFGQLREESDEK